MALLSYFERQLGATEERTTAIAGYPTCGTGKKALNNQRKSNGTGKRLLKYGEVEAISGIVAAETG